MAKSQLSLRKYHDLHSGITFTKRGHHDYPGEDQVISYCSTPWRSPLSPNSLPSGMTIGTSGAASAERDPDSLEREDDSLFPACLLELFLSHISPVKSPRFFFLGLFPSQPLTHDLSSLSESALVRSAAPVIHRNQFKCPCQKRVFALSRDCCFAGDPVRKVASTSSEQSHIARRAALLPLYLHRSIGPLLGLYQYLFCTQSTLCCSLSCQPHIQHTRTHTHADTEAIYWSKQGHNHPREGHKTLAGIFIQPREKVLWKTRPKWRPLRWTRHIKMQLKLSLISWTNQMSHRQWKTFRADLGVFRKHKSSSLRRHEQKQERTNHCETFSPCPNAPESV